MNPLAKLANQLRLYGGILVLGILVGCSGEPLYKGPTWRLVEMTDLNMVIGKWEGTVKKEGSTFSTGSVYLMIHENATYQFVGQSGENAAVGAGSLELRDGRLIGNTRRRAVTLTLYDHAGRPVLAVDSTSRETGDRYHGEFTKVP
ncbi:MAG: hypothetical protein AB7G48_10730 [Nitrospiraceae bacterium]